MNVRQYVLMILFIPLLASAGNMRDAFQEGQQMGKTGTPQAQQNLQGAFDPNAEFKEYLSTHEATKYYEGTTGSDTKMKDEGMQALGNSELGQTLRESAVNNPQDKISWDNEMIQNSFRIQENADAYYQAGEQQCTTQILSKSTFHDRFCEKESQAVAVCSEFAEVDWGEPVIYEEEIEKEESKEDNNENKGAEDDNKNKDVADKDEKKDKKVKVIKKRYFPTVKWTMRCGDGLSLRVKEQCVQPQETRTFSKEGTNYKLYSSCWEMQETYLIGGASDNSCKALEDEPNCTFGDKICVAWVGNLCVRERLKYQCQRVTKAEHTVCGDKFFCNDGSCTSSEGTMNTDFAHSVSQLAALSQAGKEATAPTSHQVRAFTGKAMFCRKHGFGYQDCCKDSGWRDNKCNTEENELGEAKQKKLVIYTGTYCDKRIFRKCVRRKSSYCVFDNKLARIVQQEGRLGQLNIGFGRAQNPDCRGLTVEELQRLKFNEMNYADFFEDVDKNQRIPNREEMMRLIEQSITQQMRK